MLQSETSSIGTSGLGDRERDQSAEGGVEVGVGHSGDTARPTLGCGLVFADTAAAINMEFNDREGEGIRDKGVGEGVVGARKDGGSENIYAELEHTTNYREKPSRGSRAIMAVIIVAPE